MSRGEPVLILKEKFVVARKEHKCKECRRIIEIGEKYCYEAFVGDDFCIHKTCRHCYPVRDLVMEMDFDGMFTYGMLLDDLYNSSCIDDRDEWRARLAAAGIRRKWKRKDGKMWRVLTF